MKVLETERLALRWLNAEDAEFILQLVNEPGWLRHIGDRGIKTLADSRNYIESGPAAMYRHYGFGLYIAELKTSGEPVGICGLIKRETLPDVDLGFAMLAKFQLKGYAFESASAVMSYSHGELGISRVAAITVPANELSIRLLEKLGFRFERSLRLAADGPELNLYGVEIPWPRIERG